MAKRRKSEKLVASVAAFDEDGKLLFALRSDMQRWVLPGGHLEVDDEGNPEDPRKGAVRELREETGLKPLSLRYLGHGVVRRETGNVRVFCFKAKVAGKPHGDDDPDHECQTFRFVDVKHGIPDDITAHLRDKNNVTLRLLGLQEGEIRKHEVLEKAFEDDLEIPPPDFDAKAKSINPNYWLTMSAMERHGYWNHYRWKISRKPDESDADFLGRSPDPYDRAQSLKVPSTEKKHIMKASKDVACLGAVGTVHFFAHPLFDTEVAANMIGSGMALPISWKRLALEHSYDELEPEHLEDAVQGLTSKTLDHANEVLKTGQWSPPPNTDFMQEELGFGAELIKHPNLSSDQIKRLALYMPDSMRAATGRDLMQSARLDQPVVDDLVKEHLKMSDAHLIPALGTRTQALLHVLSNYDLSDDTYDQILSYSSKRPIQVIGLPERVDTNSLEATIARNPRLPARHLAKLIDASRLPAYDRISEPHATVRMEAMKHPKLTPEMIDTALNDPKDSVRYGAMNRYDLIQPRHLEKASQDSSDLVRFGAAASVKATPEFLQKMYDDQYQGIPQETRQRAEIDPGQRKAINVFMSRISEFIVANPNVSDQLYRHIATNIMPSRPTLAHAALKNPNHTPAKAQALLDSLEVGAQDVDDRDHLDDRATDQIVHALTEGQYTHELTRDGAHKILHSPIVGFRSKELLFTGHSPFEADDLHKIVHDPTLTENLRAYAVGHHRAKIETVRAALTSAVPPSDHVATRAIAHPGLTGEELRYQAGVRSNRGFLEQLLKHPNAGSEHVSAAMRDNPQFAAQYLRHGDKVNLDHIKQGLQDKDAQVRAAAVGHPLAPIEEVRRLALDPNEEYAVRTSALNTGKLLEEDLQKIVAEEKPGDVNQLTQTMMRGNSLAGEARGILAKESPDMVFNEKVGVKLGLGKLRKIRDLISAKAGRMFMHQKELPPGDWSPGRGPDGNIHASKLQQHIDKQPAMNFNVSHSEWNGAQRHSTQPSKVFQLNITSEQVKKLKQAGVYNTFRKMQEASSQSSHPVAKYHGIGWVRYTGGPGRRGDGEKGAPGQYFIDEVQSDFGQSFVRQAAAQAAAQDMDPEHAAAEAQKQYPEEHFKQISQILFNGKHPNEIIHEAFQQWLRDNGDHDARVQVHTVESKAPISLGRSLPTKMSNCHTCGRSQHDHRQTGHLSHSFQPSADEESCIAELPDYDDAGQPTGGLVYCNSPEHEHKGPVQDHHFVGKPEVDRTKAPGHFNVTYHDVPKKMGAEPSTYGKLRTQTNADMKGEPTWEMKVRKTERLAKALGWLPAFRHQQTGAVVSCPEGYHDLNVLSQGNDQGYDTGFVNPEGVYHTREQTQQLLNLNGKNSGALHAAQVRKTETWLAMQRLVKQIDPKHMKPVAKYHDGALGETFVDHSKEEDQHPAHHQAHVNAFKAQVIDHPDIIKRGKTGTRTASNSTGKVVYEVNDHNLDGQSDHRFMVKPYHEKIVPRAKAWMQFPIQGWAEMTNQSLYHAAQIGHLHQKVHVAEVPMQGEGPVKKPRRQFNNWYREYHKAPPQGMTYADFIKQKMKPIKEYEAQEAAGRLPETPPAQTAPALVVHMAPDVESTVWSRMKDFSNDERLDAKKIGLMDFLTNNLDRHGHNLLWDNANNHFLAIDHSRSFQYKGPDKGFDLTASEKRSRERSDELADNLRNYIGRQSAIGQVDTRPDLRHTDDQGMMMLTEEQRQKDHKERANLWNQEWGKVFEWWGKTAPAIKKKMDERLMLIKDQGVREHVKKNFDVRAAQLDDYANLGHENFGQHDWDKTPVSIFRYR